ncbi:hypothetical protein PVAP13_6NG276503 [Panicum virgatum]|uniref:Uncharacterized protein n=1 Tax=Panicum virgatum TaxID=38727 RepID=A0A8T0R1D5_PANVG|nr:hypothetical protein PVAP13_6NG276503 [Panicum virgatum]
MASAPPWQARPRRIHNLHSRTHPKSCHHRRRPHGHHRSSFHLLHGRMPGGHRISALSAPPRPPSATAEAPSASTTPHTRRHHGRTWPAHRDRRWPAANPRPTLKGAGESMEKGRRRRSTPTPTAALGTTRGGARRGALQQRRQQRTALATAAPTGARRRSQWCTPTTYAGVGGGLQGAAARPHQEAGGGGTQVRQRRTRRSPPGRGHQAAAPHRASSGGGGGSRSWGVRVSTLTAPSLYGPATARPVLGQIGPQAEPPEARQARPGQTDGQPSRAGFSFMQFYKKAPGL